MHFIREKLLFTILYTSKGSAIDSAKIHYLFSELLVKTSSATYYLLLTIIAIIQALIYLIMLSTMLIQETLIGVLILMITGTITLKLFNFTKNYTKTISPIWDKFSKKMEQIAKNIIFIKISHAEKLELDYTSRLSKQYYEKQINSIKINQIPHLVTEVFGIMFIIGLVYYNLKFGKQNSTILLPFIYLFYRLIQQVNTSNNTFGHFNMAFNSYEYFMQYDKKYKILSTKPNLITVQKTPIKSAAPAIEIKNLMFYWTPEKPIFHNLNLSFKTGETVAILGHSGMGKTTLLKLLLGIIEPKSGEILVDNLLPVQYREKYYDAIGYVGVEPFLIEGSIRTNLLYGNHSNTISDKDLFKALKKANLYQEIQEKTLDYQITAKDEGLSAGQKQRLSIARALLKEPAFLILDEPTANLNEEMEDEIVTTLSSLKGKSTIIIVTHRKKLAKHADNVIDLGQIHQFTSA